MYLHIGQNTVIRTDDIAALGNFIAYMKRHGAWIATCEEVARYVLAQAEKAGRVVNVSFEMPKSFLLCSEEQKGVICYITQISTATLLKRCGVWQESPMLETGGTAE